MNGSVKLVAKEGCTFSDGIAYKLHDEKMTNSH